MNVPYTRQFHLGDKGPDVEGVGRALTRSRTKGNTSYYAFIALPLRIRRTWGSRKQKDLRRFKKANGLKADFAYTKQAHAKLVAKGAFDAKARKLMAEKTATPTLIEPRQGFASLSKSLWQAYSMGRHMGLSDEGTFNPSSRLPSGAPSDHAVYPAYAFDLGTSGHDSAGWRFFQQMTHRPEVEYVIFHDKIWSRSSGLHAYTYGGHDTHVHTSGRRGFVARLVSVVSGR